MNVFLAFIFLTESALTTHWDHLDRRKGMLLYKKLTPSCCMGQRLWNLAETTDASQYFICHRTQTSFISTYNKCKSVSASAGDHYGTDCPGKVFLKTASWSICELHVYPVLFKIMRLDQYVQEISRKQRETSETGKKVCLQTACFTNWTNTVELYWQIVTLFCFPCRRSIWSRFSR